MPKTESKEEQLFRLWVDMIEKQGESIPFETLIKILQTVPQLRESVFTLLEQRAELNIKVPDEAWLWTARTLPSFRERAWMRFMENSPQKRSLFWACDNIPELADRAHMEITRIEKANQPFQKILQHMQVLVSQR